MSELCNKHPGCYIIFDNWGGCPICKMENLLENLLDDTTHERDDLDETLEEKENEIENLEETITELKAEIQDIDNKREQLKEQVETFNKLQVPEYVQKKVGNKYEQ